MKVLLTEEQLSFLIENSVDTDLNPEKRNSDYILTNPQQIENI